MSVTVHILDPLTDSRWDAFLDRHPRASVFHSRAWLDALKRTYGYDPLVMTTTGNGDLENGLVLCRVRTWLSRRLVSLPFSDHCEPLVCRPDDVVPMIEFLAGLMRSGRWSSLELRPRFEGLLADGGRSFEVAEGARYSLHTLDLGRPAAQVFAGFHPSSTQRAIRRAEREALSYEAGSSERLLEAFYGLLRLTRRRHGLPPQPLAWFRNLMACMGDRLTIHLASKDTLPVASILTLTFKKTLCYKYGGSDAAHHSLGGMPFLFWRAIQAAQAQGIEELDLGRSDLDQPGLIAFKEHLGAVRSNLTYFTHPRRRTNTGRRSSLARAARWAACRLPDAVLDLSSRLLYRHLG